MADELRIGRATRRAQGQPVAAPRPPAPVNADGSLSFDDPPPSAGQAQAAQQQPVETPAGGGGPAAPPQSPEEAELRFWRRYGPRVLALALGGEVVELPDTIDGWYDLAMKTRDALARPAGYAPAVLRHLAQVLEPQKKEAKGG